MTLNKLPARGENLILVRLTDQAKEILYPPYLYYALENLWRQGYFYKYSQGTLQQYIKLEDVKNIQIGERYKLSDLAEVKILDDTPLMENDILIMRVGSKKTVGRPFWVMSVDPLTIRAGGQVEASEEFIMTYLSAIGKMFAVGIVLVLLYNVLTQNKNVSTNTYMSLVRDVLTSALSSSAISSLME
jgi:hypothetical protein